MLLEKDFLQIRGRLLQINNMVQAREHTSARDVQHLRKLGSQSAYAPEGGLTPPAFPPHVICELYEREELWHQRKVKKSIITI